MTKTVKTAKASRKRTKRRTSRVLLSMTGQGMKDGWLTIQVPARLAALIAVAVIALIVAVNFSPELAARLAALLAQATQLFTPDQRP